MPLDAFRRAFFRFKVVARMSYCELVMPRAHRLGVQAGVFHLTHRCHNRSHFLRFTRDRNAYRDLMQKLERFGISILEYCLDLEKLCRRLGTASIEDVRMNSEAALNRMIARDKLGREACRTDSLAVGSPCFLERVRPLILGQAEMEIVEEHPGLWVLRETEVPCGQE